jgi:hypothetical protein
MPEVNKSFGPDNGNAGTTNATEPLAPDQKVLFTWPDGFNVAAKGLKFLPNEAAQVELLTGLIQWMGQF